MYSPFAIIIQTKSKMQISSPWLYRAIVLPVEKVLRIEICDLYQDPSSDSELYVVNNLQILLRYVNFF